MEDQIGKLPKIKKMRCSFEDKINLLSFFQLTEVLKKIVSFTAKGKGSFPPCRDEPFSLLLSRLK